MLVSGSVWFRVSGLLVGQWCLRSKAPKHRDICCPLLGNQNDRENQKEAEASSQSVVKNRRAQGSWLLVSVSRALVVSRVLRL